MFQRRRLELISEGMLFPNSSIFGKRMLIIFLVAKDPIL